jgi:hypothetical protein
MQVARETYAVLRGNPALAIFPVLSSIAGFVVSLPFLIPIGLTLYGQSATHHAPVMNALQWVLFGCLYFANSFVIVFFNAALVACANEELNGRHSTVAFGVETAMKRLPQIIGWAIVSSTIGLILKAISERIGAFGAVVTAILGIAWNLAVFFVVPSLVLEGLGPIEAIKSSSNTMKKAWGQRIVAGAGLGLLSVLLMLVAVIPIGIGIALFTVNSFVLGGIAIFFGIVYMVSVGIFVSSLTTIFQTALFLYTRSGEIPAGFQTATIQGAFVEKPARSAFGRKF